MHIMKVNDEPRQCCECGETVEVYFDVMFENFIPFRCTPIGYFPMRLTLCEKCAVSVFGAFDYCDETNEA